jgi:hypothetical protein
VLHLELGYVITNSPSGNDNKLCVTLKQNTIKLGRRLAVQGLQKAAHDILLVSFRLRRVIQGVREVEMCYRFTNLHASV